MRTGWVGGAAAAGWAGGAGWMAGAGRAGWAAAGGEAAVGAAAPGVTVGVGAGAAGAVAGGVGAVAAARGGGVAGTAVGADAGGVTSARTDGTAADGSSAGAPVAAGAGFVDCPIPGAGRGAAGAATGACAADAGASLKVHVPSGRRITSRPLSVRARCGDWAGVWAKAGTVVSASTATRLALPSAAVARTVFSQPKPGETIWRSCVMPAPASSANRRGKLERPASTCRAAATERQVCRQGACATISPILAQADVTAAAGDAVGERDHDRRQRQHGEAEHGDGTEIATFLQVEDQHR